jgi:DNA replication and repair protein RecF
VRLLELSLRDFRSYEEATVGVGPGLTVLAGPNGAGKTNLLEGLYFGCTGRSCRTTNERELVRFGAQATRVGVSFAAEDGAHEIAVGFAPGQPKRLRIDGAPVERLLDSAVRPLVSVFLPDRLELVKGAPGVRRAHLDQVVVALWPARAANRRAYAQALAQRNALISRIRTGSASRGALATWDAELARYGIALMHDRDETVSTVAGPCREVGAALGLGEELSVAYRPRSRANDAGQLAAELAERIEQDVERGFTGHGPHRDELVLSLGGRDLRTYGSQGQQRLALLALLLAEREAISSWRAAPPMMLLDDVMSELDRVRRQALVEVLRAGGQSLLTTTDFEHVPGVEDEDVVRLAVADGQVLVEAAAA